METATKRMILGIGLLFVIGFGFFSWTQGWLSAWLWFIPPPPGTPPAGEQEVHVNVVFYSKDALSGADQDVNWNIYDASGSFIESGTASSGKVTVGAMQISGTKLKIQCVANDPSDGMGGAVYPSVVYTVTVPWADPGDTVSLGTFKVYDTSTAMTIATWDQGGASIADSVNNYFNTTDTGFTFMLHTCVSDDSHGLGAIIQYLETGDFYGGGYIVWNFLQFYCINQRGTVSQQFVADYTFTDPTNVYYAWRIDRIVNDADVPDDGVYSVFISVTSGSLAADATVAIDFYDMAKCESNGKPIWGSIAASDVDDTAIDTKVA